jgi:hypothetical protein
MPRAGEDVDDMKYPVAKGWANLPKRATPIFIRLSVKAELSALRTTPAEVDSVVSNE